MAELSKKEKQYIKEKMDFEENLEDDSEQGLDRDFSMKPQGQYPSDMNPLDYVQYKTLRIKPEELDEYKGNLDKDWILANSKGEKADLDLCRFQLGTGTLIKHVFVKDELVPGFDGNGQQISVNGEPVFFRSKGFDVENFGVISEFVRMDMKAILIGSRSIGHDREAILDKMDTMKKVVEKRKEVKDKSFGFGG